MMELENFMLNKVSQAQKIKGCMFSLKRRTYIHIYSDRENKIVLVNLSEEVGEMLENEKY
jgi:hypothetical protein